jgi:hypothetical protein
MTSIVYFVKVIFVHRFVYKIEKMNMFILFPFSANYSHVQKMKRQILIVILIVVFLGIVLADAIPMNGNNYSIFIHSMKNSYVQQFLF